MRNAVSEAKPRNAEELWSSSPSLEQKLVDSMNADVKQFSETEDLQLKMSSGIHRRDKPAGISHFRQSTFEKC